MSNLTPAQQTILEAAANRADGSIYPLPGNIKGGAAKKVVEVLTAKRLVDETGRITTLGQNAVAPDWNARAASTDDHIAAAKQTSDWSVRQTESLEQEIAFDAAGQTDEPPADADFEEDVTAAEQSLAEAENPNILLEADEDYLRIARKHLPEELVTPINWPWIRNALTDAYMLGHADAKQKKARQISEPGTPRRTRENSKQAQVITMLKRPEGATIEQITEATNWNSNTARGVLAGALKKRLGLNVVRMPQNASGQSVYRIES